MVAELRGTSPVDEFILNTPDLRLMLRGGWESTDYAPLGALRIPTIAPVHGG